MTTTTCSLRIKDFLLPVYLGLTDAERFQSQTISLELEMWFDTLPKACQTDQIDDTNCYAHIITAIQDQTCDKRFHLLEHLGYDIFHLVKALLPPPAKISVKVTKQPKIAGFDGNVQFHLADA